MKSAFVRVGLFLLTYVLLLWLASIPKGMSPPRFADLTWGVVASLAVLTMTQLFLRNERRAPGEVGLGVDLHAALNFAQWAVGEKESPGFWTLTVDPSHTTRTAAIAPFIGATVTVVASLGLWWWHTRFRSPR